MNTLANTFIVLNEKAFTKLFHLHYASLCLFASRLLSDDKAAEDVVTASFITLWKNNDIKFGHEKQIKSWLYTAVHNAAINWLKREKKIRAKHNEQRYLACMETQEYKLQQMIKTEVIEEVFAVIETLPAGCRQVFEMFYFEGKPMKRIAIELRLSINTVKTQKARGLAILREKLPPIAFATSLFFSHCH